MLRESRIRTVVLTVRYGVRASYYDDWLDAFESSPHFAITAFNLFRRGERRAAMRAVHDAELVVALHSCSADTLRFINPLRQALKARRGRLLMLVGNEYNLPWMPAVGQARLPARASAPIGSARSCRLKQANGSMAIPAVRCLHCRMPPTKRCFAATSRMRCAPDRSGGPQLPVSGLSRRRRAQPRL